MTAATPVLKQTVEMVNIGKGPAKNVTLDYYIEKVDSYAAPQFTGSTFGHITSGIIYPNDPVD